MESSNGLPPSADSIYADIATTEEPLSSPDAPLFDTTPSNTPTELASPVAEALPVLTEEEREQLQNELTEIETDILALRQTLRAKEIDAKEIKGRLGITPIGEFTFRAKQSWGSVQQSNVYQTTSTTLKGWNDSFVNSETYSKTKTGLQSAGQKTGAAFSTFGSAVTRKLGEVRGSNAFKSFEEKVSTAATNVKTRVAGPNQDNGSFQDALNENPSEGDMRTSQSADNIPLHMDT